MKVQDDIMVGTHHHHVVLCSYTDQPPTCLCVSQVVSHLKDSYKKYFTDFAAVATRPDASKTSTIVGLIRHVMGMSIAIRSLWRGRGKLKVALKCVAATVAALVDSPALTPVSLWYCCGRSFQVKVTNPSSRPFQLNRIRVEITTQHRRRLKNGRSIVGRQRHLMSLAVQGVHVAANAVDQEIDVTVHGGMVRALAVAVAVAARVDVDVVPVRAGD